MLGALENGRSVNAGNYGSTGEREISTLTLISTSDDKSPVRNLNIIKSVSVSPIQWAKYQKKYCKTSTIRGQHFHHDHHEKDKGTNDIISIIIIKKIKDD